MSEFKASGSDTESVEVAKRRYLAYVDKDRAAMERLIAEDFHFTSPLDNRINRKTYFERCWPNSSGSPNSSSLAPFPTMIAST